MLFAADSRRGARRDSRLAGAAGAARTIGIPTVAIGAEAALAGLPAGVEPLVVPPAADAIAARAAHAARSRFSC